MKCEANVVMLHINDILPNRFQPRIKFSENKIGELAESIKKYGVIQPIIVRRVGDKYEIIAGERRYKASVLAGLKEIPAIINDLDDKDSSEVALIENVQRENLTPIEEAISYKKILDMGYHTQENLATKLGVSQSAVANKLRLLNLTEEVQEALLENKISERHARSLLKLKNNNDQVQMLYRVIQERLTVRKLDEEIEKLLKRESHNSTLEEKEDLNEEIEILNILNSYKEEKKKIEKKEEEKNMNPNDPMNQFDIPEVNMTNNNVQAVPNNQMQAPLSDANHVNNFINNNIEGTTISNPLPDAMINPGLNNNAPGFMDIDRIQREAVDITEGIPTPPVTSMQTESPLINADIQSVPQAEIAERQGKFFDVLPSVQNHQENMGVQNENFMNPNPSISTPSLDGSSNFTNILENPTIEPVPMQNLSSISENGNMTSSFEQPLVSPLATGDISGADGTGDVSSSLAENSMESNNVPLEGPIVVDPFQTNTINNNEIQPPVNATSNISVNDAIHNEVVSPLPTFDFNMQGSSSQIGIPEANMQAEIPSIEQVSTSESDNISQPIINMGIPEVPIIEPIPVNPVPQEPAGTTIDSVSPLVNEELNTVTEVPPVSLQPIMNESSPFNVNSQVSSSTSIQMAINVINRATEEIQKLGFNATVENLDLGNLYQIIIRINK